MMYFYFFFFIFHLSTILRNRDMISEHTRTHRVKSIYDLQFFKVSFDLQLYAGVYYGPMIKVIE